MMSLVLFMNAAPIVMMHTIVTIEMINVLAP